MNILRRFGLVIAGILLPLMLWGFAVDVGVIKTFGDENNVKKIIAGSGIYDTIVTSALEQAGQETSGSEGDIPASNDIVKSSIKETFTPQLLQTSSETVIDGIYNWLDGETPQPQFTIDLTATKVQFANTISQKLEQYLATLPACPATSATQEFDPYNATCLPKGVTPQAAAAQVKNEVANNKDFLQDPTISANEIKGDCSDQGGQEACKSKQSIFDEKLNDAPKFYQKLKTSPIIIAILAVLSALAVIFLSATRRKGLRRVGITMLIIGVLLVVFAYGSSTTIDRQSVGKIKLDSPVLSESVRNLLIDVIHSLRSTYYVIGGIYAGLGLAAIIIPSLGGKKGGKKPNLEGEGKTEEDRIDLKEPDKAENFTEDKAEEKSKPKPKPAPPKPKPTVRKIKVQ